MKCAHCGSDRITNNGGGRKMCRKCGRSPHAVIKRERAPLPGLPAINTSKPTKRAADGKRKTAPAAGKTKRTVHYVIPDLQLRKGVPTDHLRWIGQDIARRKPDVIVCIGDLWDMPSLSFHDNPGSLSREGARYEDDISAGNDGLALLMAPIIAERNAVENAADDWNPRLIFCEGNHEYRIQRTIESDPRYAGTIGLHHCNVERFGFERHKFLEVVNVDGVNYCFDPDHRALTADLRWVKLRDLKVGDELVAFDEEKSAPRCGRRYRTAVVERSIIEPAPARKIVKSSDGTETTVTPEHLWLARNASTTDWKWVRTDELVPGMELCKPFDVWGESRTYDSGWLAGMFDGEGHISKPNCKQGGIQLGVAQKAGPILDSIIASLREHGAEFTPHANGNGVTSVRIGGTSAEKLRLLGKIRAMRLVRKFKAEMLGRVQCANAPTVVSVDDAAPGDVAKIQTSTGTLIVEGFAHHNCHYFQMAGSDRPIGGSMDNRLNKICATFVQGHEQGLLQHRRPLPVGRTIHGFVAGSAYMHSEDYRGPQRNNEWRGTLVLHDVRNGGDCDPMPVTLQYLARKYGGVDLHEFMAERYPNLPRGWAA